MAGDVRHARSARLEAFGVKLWRNSLSLSGCSCALPVAGSLATGSDNGLRRLSRHSFANAQRCYPRPWSLPSAGSAQPRQAVRKRGARFGRSWLHRICAIALCLALLPACSMLRPKLPEPVPIAVEPEPLTCLDRLLEACPGVETVRPESCADAVVLAGDALTALLACQDRHAELVRCVVEYQERNP